ncbi:hypothetical protein IT568_02695 [bacterium]|nr:hypothetical protein [bacterium]
MKNLILAPLIFLASVPQVKSASALFLLIQPSIRANGMGGTSVATSQHSPLSVSFNPAHLGFAASESSVNFEFYPVKTNWLPNFSEPFKLDAKALTVGYDLRRIYQNVPVSIGLAYADISLNSKYFVTEETGQIIGPFNYLQTVKAWSVGTALDYYFKVGLGFNFKNIKIAPSFSSVGGGLELLSATANAYDFGVLVQLPVLEAISKAKNKPTVSYNHFSPFIVPGFGFSKSNIGDGISYSGEPSSFPRVARMGISLNTGIVYRKENTQLRVFSFEWSSEAEDFLLKRNEAGQITYEGGAGKIGFIDNVLKFNANNDVITKRGWEINALNIVSIRRGTHNDPGGEVFYDTSGFGLSFIDIFRFARILNGKFFENNFFAFVSNHVDIHYEHSKISGSTVLDGTTFNGVTIKMFR